MSYTLVIAEKPSVAQNIAAALKVSGQKGGIHRGRRLSDLLVCRSFGGTCGG